MIEETVQLLGLKATDKVTGFAGVITTVAFDLYGCVQVILTPPAPEKVGEMIAGSWFDVGRLSLSVERVMQTPTYDRALAPTEYDKGAANKPLR